MGCARCDAGDERTGRFCPACERAYDAWSRRHATDIIWPVLAGMVMVSALGLGLPLLGTGTVAATAGVFGGAVTAITWHRLNARRRRRQFMLTSLPRAYLPTPEATR